MKRSAGVAALTLALAGCGTFQLSSGAVPLVPKTEAEMRLDNLTCKDQAVTEARTPGNQAKAFLLGATIVGAPAGYELEKSAQRDAYAACMTKLGYRVIPAVDGGQPRSLTTVSATLPGNWTSRALSANETGRGIVAYGDDSANDLHAFVAFSPKGMAPNAETLLENRSTAIANELSGAARSQPEPFQAGAQRALRTTITGTSKINAAPLVYVVSAIEGKDDSALVVAWTTAKAFPAHRSTLESIAHRVSGLR